MTGDTGLLLRITLVVGLVLASVTAAHADEPTLLDRTISTCVGPEFNPALDLNGMIAGITGESCVRACRAAERGCKAVVRAVDRCGVSFLRAAAKTRIEVCRGLGGTSRECRVFKDIVKPDIAWWKAAGKVEQADCDADTRALCMNRCHPLALSGPTPIRVPGPLTPQGGGASASLSLYDQLVPAPRPESQPGGAGSTSGFIYPIQYLGGARLVADYQMGPARATLEAIPNTELKTISNNPEVFKQAESVIEFLE